ncbi:MAG: ribosome recycling factor [Clostridia bacterium]|jgi:ribosome recycling factor|nr:ribosome recycling factor [Clostridia bacterium]
MDYQEIEDKMQKAVDYLQEELVAIRAGRANPAILNKVTVDYYGAQTPLNQVGAISVPEARQILITPWDKSLIGPITKAIQMAELGVNPINDGNGVRLTFPELNEDRRKQIVKEVKALGEDAKVAVRNVRRDGIDDAKKQEKAGEITEDELKGAEDKIQKITDKFTAKIDEMISAKEKEVMEV